MNKITLLIAILLATSSVWAETYTVERVIDGDTLKLTNGEVVKLIGVEAPTKLSIDGVYYSEIEPSEELELKAQRWGVNLELMDKMGQEATEFVKSLGLEGKEVRLEFDVQKKNKYGRLLAYVYIFICDTCKYDGIYGHEYIYLDETKLYVFINATIIKAGYAQPMTIPPNVKHSDLFQELYKEAREQKRGLWKDEKIKSTECRDNSDCEHIKCDNGWHKLCVGENCLCISQ